MPKPRFQPTRSTHSAKETHLQVHHKAPKDGLFLPRIRLGDKVSLGEVLGEVLSLDAVPCEVRAEDTGRVVMIRVQRSVLRGDPLLVVAPL
jgi:predicted deacylase